MELIRGLYNLKRKHKGCVATIGNFDGVHLGHQKIISDLLQQAKINNTSSCIINFEPYPQEFFLNTNAPPRLSRTIDKINIYQQYNINQLLLLKFNTQLQNLSAEAFVQNILVNGLAIKHLIVGDDFKFGKGRKGNFKLLQKLGNQYHFTVSNSATTCLNNQRVSSTRIRNCLQTGDLSTAKNLLGRPFSICARVVHGHKRGRTIGFPTANLPIHRKTSPVSGVFAVQATLNDKTLQGVANVGNRPTVNGFNTLLEVHFFNLDENLYGKMLNVQLLKKIRDEQKFDSFDLLKKQIEQDAIDAKNYFAKLSN